jgi:O-methyltransferase domain
MNTALTTTLSTTVPAAPPASAVRMGQRLQQAMQRLVYKLGPPQFTLMGVVSERWRADALAALARHAVPDLLEAGPQSVDELAAARGLNTDALYRVLRGLARDGFFEELPGRRFGLNNLSAPLTAAHPHSMRNMVMELAAPRNAACWSRLTTALQTGSQTWSESHEADMWTWLDGHPEEHAIFHGAMTELTREAAGPIARGWDFGRFDSVVDIGGGTGLLLASILKVYPNLSGILVDSASVVAAAPALLSHFGVADRCTIVPGDIFGDVVPAGRGVYLAKNITHGVSDELLLRVLRSWRAGMRPDSRLVLVDVVVPEHDGAYLSFLDLQMLLVSEGGRERTEKEFAAAFTACGLALEAVVPTATPMSLIVARPV